jgi:ArsR family transcriptional regulator
MIDVVPAPTAVAAASRDAAALLAVVAEPVRWLLLATLADGAAREVCHLQTITAVPPNLLSYHLGVLRRNRLVRSARRGRSVWYAICADALPRLRAALPAAPEPPIARAAP